MTDYDRRCVYRTFQIDANRINASGRLDYMNQLEKWREDRVILIHMSETAQEEAAHGSTRRRQKAYGHIFTLSAISTPEETDQRRRIEATLFPNGASTPNERNDVDIVFSALKYGCILVTNDGGSRSQPGGILGNREQLQTLGVQVLTDEEAVACVRQLIHERDERERERASRLGQPLPEWVGND